MKAESLYPSYQMGWIHEEEKNHVTLYLNKTNVVCVAVILAEYLIF